MATLVIEIPDEQMERLRRRADAAGITLEELFQASAEELDTKEELDLQTAIAYVLEKNAELYRRLA